MMKPRYAALLALALATPLGAAKEPAGAAKEPPLRLEAIPGSPAKRVTLTAKAAERLGIETAPVQEQPIARKQVVGGLVMPPPQAQPDPPPAGGGFGGFVRAPSAAGEAPAAAGTSAPGAGTSAPGAQAWVLVMLSAAEWERVAKDRPARLAPLATREALAKPLFARPSDMAPVEDTRRSMLRVYYVLPGAEHGLALNRRVRVELELAGNDEKRKVVPYGAVYYDPKGAAWLYVTPRPLVFERRPIAVERIAGGLAVLSEGPPVGTAVVSVGAALLYGAEIFGK